MAHLNYNSDMEIKVKKKKHDPNKHLVALIWCVIAKLKASNKYDFVKSNCYFFF